MNRAQSLVFLLGLIITIIIVNSMYIIWHPVGIAAVVYIICCCAVGWFMADIMCIISKSLK